MSRFEKIFVPVPQECMGVVIGTGGGNINQLKRETDTRITSCNGDNSGKESGFIVTGTVIGCENARLAIRHRIDNVPVTIKEPVPQQFVHLLTGKHGRDNFRVIEKECGVKITWPKFSGTEKHVVFNMKGLRSNCEHAKETLRASMERWEDNEVKSASSAASLSPTHLKVNDDRIKIDVHVPKKHIGLVVGKGRKNIEKIETKSGTKIKVPSLRNVEAQRGDKIKLEITGTAENCARAKSLIQNDISAFLDKMTGKEFGGYTHFVCVAFKDENELFRFKPSGPPPTQDNFIKGPRFRIVTEMDDDDPQSEISDKTISEIQGHLFTSLQKLKKIKDEKELIADLWCHFGKVLVSSVDEEEAQKTISPADIKKRLINNKNKDDSWKVSFEEGINSNDVNDDALPHFENENHEFPGLKLVHTQWRYDFGFLTPNNRNVRLKAWESLPPGNDEQPPVEVKNILTPVFFQSEDGIKAWICYPSTSFLKGEIMTPNSQYDCRIKLRAGYRYVTDKDNVCIEEDDILSDYLSNCQFDHAKHHMDLPDEKDHEMPEGFGCGFKREAQERIFEATVDEECFTIIVSDEKGWDSDFSDRRDKDQFSIRVVMNSWSEALLSSERCWTPEEILDKLENYMGFLSLLKNFLFVE